MTEEERQLFDDLADQLDDDAAYTPPAVIAVFIACGLAVVGGGVTALVTMSWQVVVGTLCFMLGSVIVGGALAAGQISRHKARQRAKRQGPWPTS